MNEESLTDIVAERQCFRIMEKNSFEDTRIASKNIFVTATYILGVTLKISGRFQESLDIFKELHKDLVNNKDDLQRDVLFHICNCYKCLFFKIGLDEKNFKLAKGLCLKILKIEKEDPFGLQHLAFSQYKLGEKDEARQTVKRLLSLYPNDPITKTDVAYFSILDKNYKNAFKHYKALRELKDVGFNCQEVVEFLEIEYKKIKEPALLFAKGFISYFWGDKKLAEITLKEFINKADEETYKLMYKESKRILG